MLAQNTERSSNSNAEWHTSFTTPEFKNFLHFVQRAVATGLVTGRARREIVLVLRTFISAHTMFPKSEQYTTVCRKLISKYASLQDKEGSTKFVRTDCYAFNNFIFK